MSKAQTQIPVSSNQQHSEFRDVPDMGPIRQVTYRMWYRDCWDMDKTFTKDFTYNGPRDQILVQVRYELGHYGGIKAELIEGDME